MLFARFPAGHWRGASAFRVRKAHGISAGRSGRDRAAGPRREREKRGCRYARGRAGTVGRRASALPLNIQRVVALLIALTISLLRWLDLCLRSAVERFLYQARSKYRILTNSGELLIIARCPAGISVEQIDPSVDSGVSRGWRNRAKCGSLGFCWWWCAEAFCWYG